MHVLVLEEFTAYEQHSLLYLQTFLLPLFFLLMSSILLSADRRDEGMRRKAWQVSMTTAFYLLFLHGVGGEESVWQRY